MKDLGPVKLHGYPMLLDIISMSSEPTPLLTAVTELSYLVVSSSLMNVEDRNR